MSTSKERQVTAYLNHKHYNKVEKDHLEKGISKSKIVNEALREYYDKRK